MRIALRTVAALALLALSLRSAPADEQRLIRVFEPRAGGPPGFVYSLAQDPEGYLWVGAITGILRYDGSEWQRVDPRLVQFVPGCVETGRTIAQAQGRLLERGSEGFAELALPPGIGPTVASAACDGEGTLWVLANAALWRQVRSGGWQRVDLSLPESSDPPRRLFPRPHVGVLCATRDRVLALDAAGRTSAAVRIAGAVDALERDDGTLLVASNIADSNCHGVFELSGAQARPLICRNARVLSVRQRGAAVWAGFDAELAVRSAGGEVSTLSWRQGLTSASFLVDRDGSLWVGSQELAQLPEPDTIAYFDARSPIWSRWLSLHGDELSLVGWHGTWTFDTVRGRLEPMSIEPRGNAVCHDAGGRRWTLGDGAFFVREAPGRLESRLPAPEVGQLGPCALDASGTLFMPTDAGLFALARGGRQPERVPLEPVASGAWPTDSNALSVSARGNELWFTSSTGVCHGTTDGTRLHDLRCEIVPGAVGPFSVLALEEGGVWASHPSLGLLARDAAGAWRSVQGLDELGPLAVNKLRPSPRGGYWLAGIGDLARVVPEDPLGARARVVERLTSGNGLIGGAWADCVEQPDGTVWAAAPTALARIPPRAPKPLEPPRRVAMTSITVGDAPVDLSRPVVLPHGNNQLEVRASAFSYRDPSRLRYRIRLHDDEPWSAPQAEPVFRLRALDSGRYTLAVAASLDGVAWTDAEAPLRFRVLGPWYLQPWALLAYAGAAALVLALVHRARVAQLLALERQRTRIAMDLHDAIGSGLGGLGLVAGIARHPGCDPARARELWDEVAETSAELGTSLSEIVWSLRPGSERLDALALHLRDRGRRLFPSDRPRLETAFPDPWPGVTLSLPVRRNLLLIATEALANASRHADAERVRLGFARSGTAWRLFVEDDGRGVADGVAPGGGMGLDNMRRRAEEIGARLSVRSEPGAGTTVEVLFDPA